MQGEFRINQQAEICYQCPYSTFSFENPTNMTYCKNKPNGVNISYGNYWELEKGYWRSESKPEILIECSNLKDNCQGGDGFDNHLCSEGNQQKSYLFSHIGPLCEECDTGMKYWNDTYAKTGLYSCTKCKEIQNNKLVLLGVFITLLSFLIIILFSTYKKVTNNIYRYYLTKMKICYIGSSYYRMTLSTAYLKIFLNFLQTIQMSQLIRFKDLRDILFITNVIGQPLQTVFFSIDCLLSEYILSKKQLTEVKILFVILAPLIFILLVGGMSFLVYKFKKGININKLKYITNTVVIYGLINIFSINCFRILVNALFCRQIGHDLYLKIDLTIQCDNNPDLVQKQLLFYLPACLLWSFLIPSIIFYGLFQQRSHLNKISTRYMYGFLYNEYKNNYYYWDFIRMVKNILLVIIANQYQNNGIWTFCLLAIIITQLYTVSVLLIRPFNTSHLNRQEFQSSVLSTITFFASLMMSLQENIHQNNYGGYDVEKTQSFIFNKQDNLVYFIGLFVTFLICAFSIKTIFNIFISFFERRLFFKKIMAYLFNRPITFRRFVNIQKLRKLFDGIIQFSKTESREKYDESLKNYMIKHKKQISKPNQISKFTTDQVKINKGSPLILNIYNEKSQENIELSQSVSLKMGKGKSSSSYLNIFRKLSTGSAKDENQKVEDSKIGQYNPSQSNQCSQISFNQITQIFSSPVNNNNSLNTQLITRKKNFDSDGDGIDN